MDVTQSANDISEASSALSSAEVRTRINSRHIMNMALLMVIPMLLASTLNWSRTLLVDPDIWWHLSNARILVTAHHFLRADPYSFSVAGHPWIDWEWLSEIPFWFSFRALGLRGIYLMTWLLLCANILFVYWRGYWLGRRADAALWTSALGFILMTVNSGPRLIEFAYLAMSAELAILEAADRGNRKYLWFLPPIFCLWINLHGMWFAGMVLLVVYIGCGLFSINLGVFEQKALSAKDRTQLLLVLCSSVLAVLINPYGWHLMWNPLDMALNQKLSTSTIAEWQPLSLSSFEGKAVCVAIALMIITNGIKSRKWKIYELAFVFIAWYAAISHVRFSYLAAILTIPMLAGDVARSFNSENDADTIPRMNYLMAAVALVAMVIMFPSEAKLQKMLSIMFPQKTIASIDPSWRTLNWDYVGGMMDFQNKPTFIDSRFDSFEHVGVMQEYRDIMAAQRAFEIMDKYRIDHALLKDDLPLTYVLEHTPGWRVIQREQAWQGEYVLLAKTGSVTAVASSCVPPSPPSVPSKE